MRIVFFGTPAFAVPSLAALLAEGAQVVGVVTRPDKPQGRSRSTLVPSPVKLLAERHHLPLLQPERPAGDVFLAALRQWQPELGVVVAYGHILRPDVLSLPTRGMINVHASLLPGLRGAAPIQWSILRGDAETGITILQMDRGMDSGPILHQSATPIGQHETGGELSERLAALGAVTLIEALALMRLGLLKPRAQDPALATLAPKIDRTMTRVDWTEEAAAVCRRIRAFDPEPGAWTTLDGSELKLFGVRPAAGSGSPGEVLATTPALRVATASGAVDIATVQPAGKPRMPADAWARGRPARAELVLA
ncbi:MAG TPA: methionyl-tRNA formyltransferase [Gemmatimonadales bacterium]